MGIDPRMRTFRRKWKNENEKIPLYFYMILDQLTKVNMIDFNQVSYSHENLYFY